jgi:prevent-host-death family protein
MKRVPEIVSITNLRQDAAAVVERARVSDEPIVVTQRSHAVAVLLGIEAFERMMYEREILGILAKGETEIRSAKGVSIDEVLAEASELLESP